jgi:hypothetical protein
MAEEGILGAFARIASTFVGGAPDAHRHVWNAIAPWVTDLTRQASHKWLPYLVHGIPCEVLHRDREGFGSRCPGSAIAACSVCRKPCCLNHAFVSNEGLAVCFPCIATSISAAASRIPRPSAPDAARADAAGPSEPPGAAPAPPPPLDVRIIAARKVLRVKRSASWPEIDAAYKALLRKHHPDRNPQNRAQSEARFKEVRAAYDFLKQTPGAHP